MCDRQGGRIAAYSRAPQESRGAVKRRYDLHRQSQKPEQVSWLKDIADAICDNAYRGDIAGCPLLYPYLIEELPQCVVICQLEPVGIQHKSVVLAFRKPDCQMSGWFGDGNAPPPWTIDSLLTAHKAVGGCRSIDLAQCQRCRPRCGRECCKTLSQSGLRVRLGCSLVVCW